MTHGSVDLSHLVPTAVPQRRQLVTAVPGPRSTALARRRELTVASGVASTLGNVIWILVAGIWIVIGHVTTALAMAVTIIGIPLAIANIKMIPISLMPLGKEIVPTNQPFVRSYH